jgi:peptidoglycan/LPS O-acetylase OafA/YrhL
MLEPVSGGTGVQVFFVISGFLITTLLLREQAASGRVSIRHFLLRRFLRIFPVYYLFLAVVAVLMGVRSIDPSFPGLGLAAAYASNFITQAQVTGELGHTWSLAVEEHFYLLWPLAVAWIARRHLGAVLGCVVGASLLMRYQIGLHPEWSVTHYPARWTLPAIDSIAIGCLAAWLRERHPGFRPAGARVTLLMGAGVFLATAYLWLPAGLYILVDAVKATGMAFVLIAIVESPAHPLVRFLELGPVRYCGVISYSLYIWQGLFLRTGPGGRAWFQQEWVALLLTLGVASASYHFYEKRFLRLKERLGRGGAVR